MTNEIKTWNCKFNNDVWIVVEDTENDIYTIDIGRPFNKSDILWMKHCGVKFISEGVFETNGYVAWETIPEYAEWELIR